MTAARTRLTVALALLGGVALFAAANVHLVSVAVSTQPDCVAAADAPHRPARRSC